MDFFAAQEAARSRSRTLTLLFGAAVATITATVYLVVRFAVVGPMGSGRIFDPGLFVAVAAAVGLLIGGGSWWRIRKLSAGGPVVAAMMGGRRILPGTSDPHERRLLNVVSEMAIASGTPVPAVYVLDDETGLNAFAAGYTIHDAAVAVTRGMLERTSRDELQGVIAHEFSHVLNGDMRLNIRLMGLLHGILMLAIVGRGLIRGGSGRSRRGSQAGLIGVALLGVGYAGVFFGRLIRAAISREREYLADAAAVQFTRNPQGIAGALKKIGADSSRLASHHAEEASHLFFAQGLRSHWLGFLATHPPLDERILRIDPQWDGWLVPQLPREPVGDPAALGFDGASGTAADGRATVGTSAGRIETGMAAMAGPPATAAADSLISSIGSPTAAHLRRAAEIVEEVPAEVHEALRTPDGAFAVVLAILLASGEDAAGAHRAGVLGTAGAVADRVILLAALIAPLGAEARLPLLDLALPALDTLPQDRRRSVNSAVLRAIRADGEVHLFEYALAHAVSRRLGPRRKAAAPGRSVQSFRPVRADVALVLSALAHTGGSAEAAAAAFRASVARLPSSIGEVHLQAEADTSLAAVDAALTRLERAGLGVRRRFLDACAHCIACDGRIRPEEMELLRAIAEALDCPIPPSLAPPVRPAPAPDGAAATIVLTPNP